MIAVSIVRHVGQGINRFELRLNPPELGRVEIKMNITSDGRVNAHLTVERAETLDLLQRDARFLERALNESGLNADKDSLSFSLKDQKHSGFQDGQENENNAHHARNDGEMDDAGEPGLQTNIYQTLVSTSGIDIHV